MIVNELLYPVLKRFFEVYRLFANSIHTNGLKRIPNNRCNFGLESFLPNHNVNFGNILHNLFFIVTPEMIMLSQSLIIIVQLRQHTYYICSDL